MMDRSTPVALVTFPPDNGFAGSGSVLITGTADDRYCFFHPPGSGPEECVVGGKRDFQSGIR
ncbi:MAG: hypothetical protein HYV15_07065, partial [Elusimicrobia bacterium]|nr:hypothetical protein [Elusimicrobiota bacterium]